MSAPDGVDMYPLTMLITAPQGAFGGRIPTNAIESLHSQLRKIIKTRGHFPSDAAATKLLWLALRNITAERGRSVREWRDAMHQFAIAYGDRFTRNAA